MWVVNFVHEGFPEAGGLAGPRGMDKEEARRWAQQQARALESVYPGMQAQPWDGDALRVTRNGALVTTLVLVEGEPDDGR